MVAINLTTLGLEVSFDPEAVKPPNVDEGLFPRPCSLALDVSGSCNLRCVYCAENSTMPRREPMQMKTLKQCINSICDWSEPESGVSIHLGSGEPFLNPKLVQATGEIAHAVAKKRNQPLSLYVTTNGTLLNHEMEKWLIRDKWNVKISLDGDQATHDLFRIDKSGEGTYSTTKTVVNQLAKQIPERFSTTSVLCHGTNPREVFYSIASLGVTRIEIVPVAAVDGSKYALREGDFDVYRSFILEYAQKLAKSEHVPVNIRFHKRLMKTLGYGNSRVPCGAGRTFFAAGSQGDIYPCFRFVGVSKYKLGDLSAISKEKVKEFTASSGRTYEYRKKCQECWAAPLCGGPCYACADLIGSGSPLPSYCKIVQIESEAALWLSSYLRKNNVKRLIELMGIEVLEEQESAGYLS